ncbi:hypothetical protein CHLNCDRAFT_137501 [Chlorella variabilis]|uniref:Uncharacterized protein n=1 Tax=Chlorella variabilis TaxID=554065 RepID=E1ZMK5_CHLVA|nr:hypothetical protein CHLNCDRAFT_137501 [Chlorella variabilis]EFN53015.1 hypothetical protein CHLNCDRAFT_137501 [Chlorella variabilis]|eukprot:XP_005845117.1 hypothetical protein CHLNCDRAFT_137501 [Chlorella variabilis]
MAVLQRLSGCLAQTLRLSSRQSAALQQGAALHLSATLEARRRAGPASSDSDSDEEVLSPEEQLYEEVEMNAAAGWEIQTAVSPALAAALEAAPDDPDEADSIFEKLADVVERIESGQVTEEEVMEALGNDPDSPIEDHLRLVLEALDLYFMAAPEADPEVDSLEEFDRDLLQGLAEGLHEVLDGTRSTTVNVAPPGRLPWEVLEVDEETPMINWGVDLTEGRAADPWKNALLSEEAKELMYEMHAKQGWEVPALAEHFRIRQQRVMAIVALKEREHAARQAGIKLHTELAEALEDEFGAHHVVGSGEWHHVVLPSFPNFKELTEAEAGRLAALLEKRVGKPFDEIEPEDMSVEVTQEALGPPAVLLQVLSLQGAGLGAGAAGLGAGLLAAAGMDKEALEQELAEKEEEHLVAEFRRSLDYNLGKTGASLSRSSRKKHPPKRPEGGWGLLVQPLGKAARSGERQPYVSAPDGSQRELTADEKLHVERQQPRPRSKIL